MLYVPFRLRKTTKLIVPQEITITEKDRVSVDLAGNKISLCLPKHCPEYRESVTEVFKSGRVDINSSAVYDDPNPIKPWESGTVLAREWRFLGSWFTGVVGEVSFALTVSRKSLEADEGTLFNPAVLEREIDERLSQEYSEYKSHGQSEWQAPTNWKVVDNGLPLSGASYDCLKTIGGGALIKCFDFAISNNCLVSLWFRVSQYTWGGTLEEMDAKVSRGPMEKLVGDIVDSVKLELSPESLSQLKLAKELFRDEKLNEDKAPLKWATPEDDELYARYLANPNDF